MKKEQLGCECNNCICWHLIGCRCNEPANQVRDSHLGGKLKPAVIISNWNKYKMERGHVMGELFQLTWGCHLEMETLPRFFFIFIQKYTHSHTHIHTHVRLGLRPSSWVRDHVGLVTSLHRSLGLFKPLYSLSIHHPSTCPFTRPFIHLTIHLTIYPSIHPSIHGCIHRCIHPTRHSLLLDWLSKGIDFFASYLTVEVNQNVGNAQRLNEEWEQIPGTKTWQRRIICIISCSQESDRSECPFQEFICIHVAERFAHDDSSNGSVGIFSLRIVLGLILADAVGISSTILFRAVDKEVRVTIQTDRQLQSDAFQPSFSILSGIRSRILKDHFTSSSPFPSRFFQRFCALLRRYFS